MGEFGEINQKWTSNLARFCSSNKSFEAGERKGKNQMDDPIVLDWFRLVSAIFLILVEIKIPPPQSTLPEKCLIGGQKLNSDSLNWFQWLEWEKKRTAKNFNAKKWLDPFHSIPFWIMAWNGMEWIQSIGMGEKRGITIKLGRANMPGWMEFVRQ